MRLRRSEVDSRIKINPIGDEITRGARLDYLRSWGRHLGTALVDVGAVSLITLMPLLLARLGPLANPSHNSTEPFWGFLTNGQLAFYSIGSLATILMTVFRQKIPKTLGLIMGLGCIFSFLFLAWLIGIDPRLTNASVTFVGVTTLYLYIIVQLSRVIVEAAKQISPSDAFKAGERSTNSVKKGLADRKGVEADG